MAKKSNSRKIRRRVNESFAKLSEGRYERRPEAAVEEPAGSASKSGDESFAKRPSEVELHYNTKTAPEGTAFTDPRGRSYGIDSGGQLRALNKPLSRVKRLREEKREQTKKEKPART